MTRQIKIEAKSVISKRDSLLLRERIISATSIVEAWLDKDQALNANDDDVSNLITSACVFLKNQFDGYLSYEGPEITLEEMKEHEYKEPLEEMKRRQDRTMWDRPKKRPGAQDQAGELPK